MTEVNKSSTILCILYRHSGLYYVKTMLVHFCDGLQHIYYDLRLFLARTKTVVNDFGNQ